MTLGLIAVLEMCVVEIRSGQKTVDDLVLVNLMMLQLYQPLNFMGMVYRDIKQAIVDIEAMFAVLDQNPEIQDVPGAPPLKVSAGDVRFENVEFAYDPARPILRGFSFEAPPGHTIAIVGPWEPANRPFPGFSSGSTSRPPDGFSSTARTSAG